MRNKVSLQEKLAELHERKGALLATNFYNYETLKGIMKAASRSNLPVILQLTQSSIEYMGLHTAVSMARSALAEHKVEGWVHLDHSDSIELVQACLDAGFDSVMIDASEKPAEENIAVTRQVVELAQNYNANVEAELGYVAKLGQSKEKLAFTDPQEAKDFIDQTGVHALAVAIGSAHGFYKEEPRLDLPRLAAINQLAGIPLVLHGGSGIPGTILKEAVARGICKINLATDIKNIFMQSLKTCLVSTEEIDLRKVFPPAIEAVSALVQEKLNIIK
jgi:tagatose 1,6-diphosphate aldolase GatY/KbaY